MISNDVHEDRGNIILRIPPIPMRAISNEQHKISIFTVFPYSKPVYHRQLLILLEMLEYKYSNRNRTEKHKSHNLQNDERKTDKCMTNMMESSLNFEINKW